MMRVSAAFEVDGVELFAFARVTFGELVVELDGRLADLGGPIVRAWLDEIAVIARDGSRVMVFGVVLEGATAALRAEVDRRLAEARELVARGLQPWHKGKP